MIDEILSYRTVVTFNDRVTGYFNGSHKVFEFSPQRCTYRGKECVKWGSLTANLWFIIPVYSRVGDHFRAVRRKLEDSPSKITFERKTE